MFATRQLSEVIAANQRQAAGGRLWTIADRWIKARPETN
jgi:hypothetical protein